MQQSHTFYFYLRKRSDDHGLGLPVYAVHDVVLPPGVEFYRRQPTRHAVRSSQRVRRHDEWHLTWSHPARRRRRRHDQALHHEQHRGQLHQLARWCRRRQLRLRQLLPLRHASQRHRSYRCDWRSARYCEQSHEQHCAAVRPGTVDRPVSTHAAACARRLDYPYPAHHYIYPAQHADWQRQYADRYGHSQPGGTGGRPHRQPHQLSARVSDRQFGCYELGLYCNRSELRDIRVSGRHGWNLGSRGCRHGLHQHHCVRHFDRLADQPGRTPHHRSRPNCEPPA